MALADRFGSLGIVGAGSLGGAVGRAVLRARLVASEDLWLACRSGRVAGFEEWPGVQVTTDLAHLAERCETILLAVPPVLLRKRSASPRVFALAGGR